MSDVPGFTDAELFAWHAGLDVERWRALIGQRVTHVTFGEGTIKDVRQGGSRQAMLTIAFDRDDQPTRRFEAKGAYEGRLFSHLPVPLDRDTLTRIGGERIGHDRQQAELQRRLDDEPRRADRERQRERVGLPRRALDRPRVVPRKARLDVLSVPVGDTFDYVVAYEVHACPDSYSYRTTQYITFRGRGGSMWRVYDLGRTHLFLLNPDAPATIRERIIASQPIDDEAKERVRGYWADRDRARRFHNSDNEDYRFYVLPQRGNIELSHKPRPERTIQGHTYFDLGELTAGRPQVRILSRQAR